jgi:hypothetical protein
LFFGDITTSLNLGSNTLNKASVPSARINPISKNSKALVKWVGGGSSEVLVRVALLKTNNSSSTTTGHRTLAPIVIRQTLNKTSIIVREGLGSKSGEAVGISNSGHVFLLTYII